MNSEPARDDWLPPLIELSAAGGVWAAYCQLIYDRFLADFIASQPRHLGLPVKCRRDPIFEGKEAGFWHCVSEGPNESTRIPDTKRCERIAWVKAIVENSHDPDVLSWENDHRGDRRQYFWFKEAYLVVLGVRKGYFQLITAFCTDREHTRRKLRADFKASIKKLTPPS